MPWGSWKSEAFSVSKAAKSWKSDGWSGGGLRHKWLRSRGLSEGVAHTVRETGTEDAGSTLASGGGAVLAAFLS